LSPSDVDQFRSAGAVQDLCTQLRKTPPLSSGYVPRNCPHSVTLHDPITGRPYRKCCGRPKCSWQCRERWARKTATCLMKSFKDLPPTHMVRLTCFAMLSDPELTKRVTRFLERLRYRVSCEYLLVNEWSDGHRHMHILVRAGGEVAPELVSGLWRKVLGGPKSLGTSYCRPVKNPAGLAHYTVKHVRDASMAVVAPKSYRGRVMTYSKGFLSRSMKDLWREAVEEWKQPSRRGRHHGATRAH
jgi:hypothetical protein